jgi:hypothetical protein
MPGVDFRLRKSAVPGWAWIPIMAALSAFGTGVVTYYQALRAAGARLAAVEEEMRILSEAMARGKTRDTNLENGLNHEAAINQSQEKRLDGLGAGLVVKREK